MPPAIQFIPFILLSFALFLLWVSNHRNIFLRWAWLTVLGISCISAAFLNQIQGVALFIVLIVAVLAWCAGNTKLKMHWRWIAALLFIFSALALGLHIMPGFNSLLVIEKTILTPGASPYSLYFNIDKTLVALFILGFWYQRPANLLSWKATGLTLLWMLPLVTVTVIALSLLASYIQFELKIIDGLWLWMWANLLFTCTAEEALFRGLIQEQLAKYLITIFAGKWIAIVVAALLFGFAHIGGGWVYVALATVAGFGYGLVYQLTGRIEASIICHFGLNLTHILFFTYPALIPQ